MQAPGPLCAVRTGRSADVMETPRCTHPPARRAAPAPRSPPQLRSPVWPGAPRGRSSTRSGAIPRLGQQHSCAAPACSSPATPSSSSSARSARTSSPTRSSRAARRRSSVAPTSPIATDRSIDAQLLPAAREAGAKAMMVMTVAIAVQDVSQPFQIGIGGFGFGSSGSAGVGVSAPVGGGRVTSGYSANGRVTDVPSGRLVWTAKATTPPSSDVNAQMGELSTSCSARPRRRACSEPALASALGARPVARRRRRSAPPSSRRSAGSTGRSTICRLARSCFASSSKLA